MGSDISMVNEGDGSGNGTIPRSLESAA
jgi:hypothetical protein